MQSITQRKSHLARDHQPHRGVEAPGSRRSRAAASVLLTLIVAVTISGCAAQRAYKRGERAAARDEWDEAFASFLRARTLAPENPNYKVGLERARLKASQTHFKQGERLMLRGMMDDAVLEFEQAVFLDPSNQYFVNELGKAKKRQDERRKSEDSRMGEIEQLKEKVRREDPIIPILSLTSETPITLKFTDTDVKEVYNALGKLAGINVLLDEQIRDKKIGIDLSDVTFEQALDTLLLINQHYYKVIDDKTIIIIPDNQTKRRQYDELVIKTFYLSSADINEVQQLVQRLINTRFMSVSKQLNSITIRDTADKVAIAERIIEANDKAKSEVIIDVELLQINRSSFESLGAQLVESYSISQSLAQDEGGIQLSRLDKLTQNDWFLLFPDITYNFLKRDSDTRLIAKPQIRVSEGEKASLLIGDKVPVPTTTFNTNVTQGGNVVPITSFQYQDVGIKLNFEPRVHHNKEITLSLKVEVSQIIGTNESGQPTIGTRTIETVIRLEEGETNLLAGLLREDETAGKTGVPGISDIPLLGKLFSQNTSDRRKTDLVLTLTPHIIRLPNITEADLAPLYVGTEENTTLRRAPTTARTLFPPKEEETFGEVQGLDEMGDETSMDEAPADEAASEPGEEPGEEPSEEPSEEPEEEPELPASPAVILMQPAVIRTSAGGTFSVDVLVMGGSNVGHVPFYVQYDPALLTYQGASEGDFLKQGGSQTSFLVQSPKPGTIILGCSRLGTQEGASGSGRIATITFQATAAGETSLSYSNNFLKDPTTAPLPADWRGAQVTVQ